LITIDSKTGWEDTPKRSWIPWATKEGGKSWLSSWEGRFFSISIMFLVALIIFFLDIAQCGKTSWETKKASWMSSWPSCMENSTKYAGWWVDDENLERSWIDNENKESSWMRWEGIHFH